MKKPFIASAVVGIPDTAIHEKTGLLVPPDDENALTDAISQLLHNSERAKKMGLEGYNRVKECFSVDNTVKQIEQVYCEIMNRTVRI